MPYGPDLLTKEFYERLSLRINKVSPLVLESQASGADAKANSVYGALYSAHTFGDSKSKPLSRIGILAYGKENTYIYIDIYSLYSPAYTKVVL